MTQRINAEDAEMNREDAEKEELAGMGRACMPVPSVSAPSSFSSAPSALKGNANA